MRKSFFVVPAALCCLLLISACSRGPLFRTPVTGVSVSPGTAELTVGETLELTATVEPDDATDQDVSWQSGDEAVATVDETGLVTAVEPGTTEITATTVDGGFTDTATVTVSEETVAVSGVSLSPTSATVTVGQTVQLMATVSPTDATNTDVTWTSSNASIATVNTDGLVSGVAEGTASITVESVDGGLTANASVTVASDTTGLDLLFNSTGYVVHDGAAGTSGNDIGHAIIEDASGRILVTGESWNGSDRDMTVWRYDDQGNLDTTFGGGDGFVTYGGTAGGTDKTDAGYAIALDSSGRILVAGESGSINNPDMALWRLAADGTLDTSFGTNGAFVHDGAAGGSGNDYGRAIILDGDDILVGGDSNDGTSQAGVVWRVIGGDSGAGALDTTFGTNGYAVLPNAAGDALGDAVEDMAVDASGNIVAVGASKQSSTSFFTDMAVWRLTSSGALDTSFAGNGFTSYSAAAGADGNDAGNGVALDGSGNIVIAGDSRSDSNQDMVVWRLLGTGAGAGDLDTSFDGDGFAVFAGTAGGDGIDVGSDLVIAGDGSIVVTGESYNGTNQDMAIWRLNSDGSLDTSFDGSGTFVHDSAAGGSGDDIGKSVTITAAGKILVSGSSSNGSNDDMTIWRHN